ncbi:MAG: hypothetical protein RJA07_967 [Bacteroidota bacterium]|jgi:hypothetical protein
MMECKLAFLFLSFSSVLCSFLMPRLVLVWGAGMCIANEDASGLPNVRNVYDETIKKHCLHLRKKICCNYYNETKLFVKNKTTYILVSHT